MTYPTDQAACVAAVLSGEHTRPRVLVSAPSPKVTPVIDRTFKLSETAAATQYYETGSARGKIVISVE